MAYCPKCRGEMPAVAAACPHCGYDFSTSALAVESGGFAYSALADVALMISTFSAAIGCCATVYFTVAALCFGQLVSGLLLV